jgi:prepilin-type processing-associated H-X9-DG protein
MKTERNRSRGAFSLVELFVVTGIVATLIALLVPAVHKFRAAGERGECANHLKQIGVALHDYHDVYRHFPLSFTYGNGGWLYQLLPFIEQEALYQRGQSSDYSVFWSVPATTVPLYLCPADAHAATPWESKKAEYSYALTSYLGVLGSSPTVGLSGDGVFGGNFDKYVGFHPVRLTDITDGISTTLMVGERPPSLNGYWGWWWGDIYETSLWAVADRYPVTDQNDDGTGDPCPARSYFSPGDLADDCHVNHFWSFHAGGGNWLMCDGSVHFMTYSAGTTIIPVMATRDGGEEIPSH